MTAHDTIYMYIKTPFWSIAIDMLKAKRADHLFIIVNNASQSRQLETLRALRMISHLTGYYSPNNLGHDQARYHM